MSIEPRADGHTASQKAPFFFLVLVFFPLVSGLLADIMNLCLP